MANLAALIEKQEVSMMNFAFAEPTECWLEILPRIQAQSWQNSQVYATPGSRWNAYLNQICLQVCLEWIQTEYIPHATAYPSLESLPSYWQVLNGTAINLGQKRLIVVPTEAIDDSELEVPQEWVDIPAWAGDYYLAVQVKPDGEYLRIWGYTTHHQLKTHNNYDPTDRTYTLDAEHLTTDLNAFWVAYQFCPNEQTQAALDPLPEISATQAENLIQRLSNPAVTFPRLAVPFTTWAALLENDQWRQRLYQQRQGIAPSPIATAQVQLNQWIQGMYTSGWDAIATIFGPNASPLLGTFRSVTNLRDTSIRRAKLIDLGMQLQSQPVVLLLALIPQPQGQVEISVQLHPSPTQAYLPAEIKLALLSDSGEILQEVPARTQDSYIQLRFDGEAGESFALRVSRGEYQITENFVI